MSTEQGILQSENSDLNVHCGKRSTSDSRRENDQGILSSFTEQASQLRDILTGIDVKQIQEAAQEEVNDLLTLAKLTFASSDFRQTVNDFFSTFESTLKRKGSKEEEDTHNDKVRKTSGSQQVHDNDQKHSSSSDSLKLTEEREKELVSRFSDLAKKFHKHSEYRNAFEYVWSIVDKMNEEWNKGEKLVSKATKSQKSDGEQNVFSILASQTASPKEMLRFIDSWTGPQFSITYFVDSLLGFKKDLQSSKEAREFFDNMRRFFIKSPQENLDQQRIEEDARSLIQSTRQLFLDKFGSQFSRIEPELFYLNRAIQRQDLISPLQTDIGSFVKSLITDAKGNLTMPVDLTGGFQVLMSNLLDYLKEIPLPAINRNDESSELQMEKMVLNLTDVVPARIKVTGVYDSSSPDSNRLEIRLDKIHGHIRNAWFHYKNKSSLVPIDETGNVDIDLTGEKGMRLFISVSMDPNKSMFKVHEVQCTIDEFYIHLENTKHDTIYSLLSPVINSYVKSQFENLVAQNIADGISKIDTAVETVKKVTGKQ